MVRFSGEKNTEHNFLFPLQFLFETFLILRGTERDIIINVQYIGMDIKYLSQISDFNETFDRFSENSQISNLMKFRLGGAQLFHTDGWTDMTKLIVAFRNFANTHNTTVSMYCSR